MNAQQPTNHSHDSRGANASLENDVFGVCMKITLLRD